MRCKSIMSKLTPPKTTKYSLNRKFRKTAGDRKKNGAQSQFEAKNINNWMFLFVRWRQDETKMGVRNSAENHLLSCWLCWQPVWRTLDNCVNQNVVWQTKTANNAGRKQTAFYHWCQDKQVRSNRERMAKIVSVSRKTCWLCGICVVIWWKH